MKSETIIKVSKVIDTIADKETKAGNKLREVAFEKEMSIEDRKLLKDYKKNLKVLERISNKVQNDKLYDNVRHLFNLRFSSAIGHCRNQIKHIKKKYIQETEEEK